MCYSILDKYVIFTITGSLHTYTGVSPIRWSQIEICNEINRQIEIFSRLSRFDIASVRHIFTIVYPEQPGKMA